MEESSYGWFRKCLRSMGRRGRASLFYELNAVQMKIKERPFSENKTNHRGVARAEPSAFYHEIPS
jgi:hypothetical protein